ncbi:uncharacterized protein OCT59_001250 [Rhizophagus irregularis]|uniref:uncharacterized protein n=1 Tax=Rhizophagus irregularis TaxID=588596 RepID=UPI00331C901C|nr:hypothetical protein OCT59_001250 [Rhizophagus irregularis]
MTRKFSSIEDLDLLLLKILLFRHILKYTENQNLHLGSFGSEFFHYNTFRMNNSIFGVKKQTKNKIEFLFKPLPRLNDQFSIYHSSEVIYCDVSIFQQNDDKYKPDLLRQTFSGDSKLCTIGSDNYTVHIPIFESTFNQQNSTYYVLVENNFVISQERDEPLIGISKNIWTLSTKPLKTTQHSDSVTGLLQLNDEGSSKFLQMNHSVFFKNMIQEFSKIIPVTEQKLSTSGDYFEEFYLLIIILIVGLVVLILLYVLACLKNLEKRNFAIFEIIQDFAMDLAFILLKVKNTSYLMIPI